MTAVLWLIGAIFVIAIFTEAFKASSKGTRGGKARATATHAGETFSWPKRDKFEYDIVGESNYQDALKSLVGDHGDHESSQVFTATIIPEDDNPYDDKAVRIEIGDQLVGYMSRDDARSFRRRLGGKKLTGCESTCQAMITGGWKRKDGIRVSYGVRLDIKPFW